MIAVDLFSGAGGMSLGAQMAGINTAIAVELDTDSAQTYKLNHPETSVLNKDIMDIDPIAEISIKPDIIFGGPPCQGFSSSNTRTRSLQNQNNWMFKEYLRFIKELSPNWFVFENVQGFRSLNGGAFAKQVEMSFQELGYTTNSTVLCASDYGVPQKRKRFFLIGNRNGIKFDFDQLEIKAKVTVADALSDLPSLSIGSKIEKLPYRDIKPSNYAKMMRANASEALQNFVSLNQKHIIERYSYIPQGGNWKDIPIDKMTNYKNTKNIHSGIYRRLDELEPSVVIANYRKSMLVHHKEDRGLSLREAARLQSFPDNYKFCGSLDSMQQQVGNAVPPLLSNEIFKQILKLNLIKVKINA